MTKPLVVLLSMLAAPSLAAPCMAFRREQRIEAQKDGQWMKSTVVRCDGRKGYLVHFDGLASSNDAWLAEDALRLPPGVAEAAQKQKEAEAAAAAAGYKSNDYVFIQRAADKEPFVAKLWNAGPTTYSYMSAGVETRIDLADIKGKWDPSKMKYKVGDKVRYLWNGFLPATITSIEAGGYKATITGATDPNVILERFFVDEWTYDEFEAAIAPVKKLKDFRLATLAEIDKDHTTQPALPREASEESVAEFEKIVRAYEAVDAELKAKFPKLPPLERTDCSYCPVTVADTIARHKAILRFAVPLDPSRVVEEFERNMKADENSYLNDYRPDDASDVFAAKDGVAAAQKKIAQRLRKYTAYGELLGVKVDPNLPKINANIAAESAKFRKYLKKSPPLLDSFAKEGTKFAVSDKNLESVAKARLAYLYPTAKCKLLGTEKHDWRSEGSGDSYEGRFKYVGFDCTDPGYEFPFALTITVIQYHLGLGKHGPPEGRGALYSYYRR